MDDIALGDTFLGDGLGRESTPSVSVFGVFADAVTTPLLGLAGRRPRGFWAWEIIHKALSINTILHFNNKKRNVYIFLAKPIIMYNINLLLHV